jgi:hypothetical protein
MERKWEKWGENGDREKMGENGDSVCNRLCHKVLQIRFPLYAAGMNSSPGL